MKVEEASFLHFRVRNPATGAAQSRGGLTVAFVVDEAAKKITFAYAQCHGRDNYNKRLGRVKAAGRLSSPHYAQDFVGDTKEFVRNQEALAQGFSPVALFRSHGKKRKLKLVASN